MSETIKIWNECKTEEERIARIKERISDYEAYLESDDADSEKAFEFACNCAHEYLPWLLTKVENDAAQIADLQRQLAEANQVIDSVTDMIVHAKCVYCDWQGERFGIKEDPDWSKNRAQLAEHVKKCPKHPMREMERTIADLTQRAELADARVEVAEQEEEAASSRADSLKADHDRIWAENKKLVDANAELLKRSEEAERREEKWLLRSQESQADSHAYKELACKHASAKFPDGRTCGECGGYMVHKEDCMLAGEHPGGKLLDSLRASNVKMREAILKRAYQNGVCIHCGAAKSRDHLPECICILSLSPAPAQPVKCEQKKKWRGPIERGFVLCTECDGYESMPDCTCKGSGWLQPNGVPATDAEVMNDPEFEAQPAQPEGESGEGESNA